MSDGDIQPDVSNAYVATNNNTNQTGDEEETTHNSDLVLQRTRTKFGGRAFAVAGPVAWNRLPCSVRNSPSLDSFKTALKTFFFTANI